MPIFPSTYSLNLHPSYLSRQARQCSLTSDNFSIFSLVFTLTWVLPRRTFPLPSDATASEPPKPWCQKHDAVPIFTATFDARLSAGVCRPWHEFSASKQVLVCSPALGPRSLSAPCPNRSGKHVAGVPSAQVPTLATLANDRRQNAYGRRRRNGRRAEPSP